MTRGLKSEAADCDLPADRAVLSRCGLAGARLYHPGQNQDVDGRSTAPAEGLCTSRNSRARGHHVIDQQHPPPGKRRPLRPRDHKGAGHIALPRRPAEPALRLSRAAPNQQLGPHRKGGEPAKRLSQKGGLVVAPGEKADAMERHGYDHLRRIEQVGARPPKPLAEGRRPFRSIAMLESQYQSLADSIVAQHEAGPAKGRRPPDAIAAQRARPKIEGEGKSAARAVGRSGEVELRPTVGTERPRRVNHPAAGQATWRQDGIERAAEQRRHTTGHSGHLQHRPSFHAVPRPCQSANDTARLGATQTEDRRLFGQQVLEPVRPGSIVPAMADSLHVFDRPTVRRHRDRAARQLGRFDALFREVAARLADRLDDVKRRFPLALDLGCHNGPFPEAAEGRGGISTFIQCDLSPAMAQTAARKGRPSLAADEEWLPFAPQSFDLVASVLSLHWVNDLPGALIQVRQTLKPDGLFLAALLGGETLQELRAALMEAEIETRGGASPRVSPFADVADAGALLQRAGFALPVVDRDRIIASYPDALSLLRELRGLGESNAVASRSRRFAPRDTLLRAAALYEQRHAGPDGRIPATFDVIFMTGWAPHESQQQPLKPGSAAHRLATALGGHEQALPDKARPDPKPSE